MVARAVLVVAVAFGWRVGGVRADMHLGTHQLQYEVRDSAGIRILENRQPEVDSRLDWVVAAEPDVTIGTRGWRRWERGTTGRRWKHRFVAGVAVDPPRAFRRPIVNCALHNGKRS